MKFYKRFNRFLFLLTFLLFCQFSFSQQNFRRGNNDAKLGTLIGKIIDANDNAPVEFANIALYKMQDSSLLTAGSSQGDGSFIIENVPSDLYRIKVTYVGYKTLRKDSVKIIPFKPTDIGYIQIKPMSQQLDAVVVKGDKSTFESKIDRKVFNVDKSITAQAGNAADVLQQVPSVAVDQEGNVSLRGSENVNILVNGKPSMIDKSVLLQQIPANSIEKVEVITNPSAKFDPDGTSGIINIVLKQGKGQGTNAVVSINAGTKESFKGFDKYNGTVSLNYNPGKINIFSTYSYRNEDRRMWGWSERQLFDSLSVFSKSKSDGYRNRESHMGKLGFDYNLSQSFVVGLSGSINTGKGKENERIDEVNYKYGGTDSSALITDWYRKSSEDEENLSKEVTGYFLKKINTNGHELRSDYTYSEEDEEEIAGQNDFFNPLETLYNREKQTQNSSQYNHTFQLDYSWPINDKYKFESGIKSIVRKNNDYQDALTDPLLDGQYVIDTLKTSSYKYDENLYSVYSTLSYVSGNFSAIAGLRLETADTKGLGASLDSIQGFSKDYRSFFPSLHVVQKLDENNEFNFSYSRRLNRPRGNDMNPITNYSNPSFWRKGNPDLNPEYINSLELGYTFKTEKLTLQPTAFYRLTENSFTRKVDLISVPAIINGKDTIRKVNEGKMINLEEAYSYGFDMSITYSPFRFWNINLSGSIFQYTIDPTDPELNNKNKFSWNAKLMSNTMLPKGFAIQLAGFYRSPFITTQGTSKPFYSANMGLRKEFLDGKMTGTLSFNDIFNTMRFAMDVETPDQKASNYRKRESQTIMVGLTYKFGKAPREKKKPQRDNGNGGDMQDDMGF